MADITSRPKVVLHDEAPSVISDHPFEPRGAWWSLCKVCSLAESAHTESKNPPFRYISDDED